MDENFPFTLTLEEELQEIFIILNKTLKKQNQTKLLLSFSSHMTPDLQGKLKAEVMLFP